MRSCAETCRESGVEYTHGYTKARFGRSCHPKEKARIPCEHWDAGLFRFELPIRIELMTFSLRVKL